MIWLLNIFSTKAGRSIIAAAGVVAIAGFVWFQHERIQTYKTDIATKQEQLSAEFNARRAAEAAVVDAVERAERLAEARDAAQKRLTERLAAVAEAQGVCLDTALPEGLLD